MNNSLVLNEALSIPEKIDYFNQHDKNDSLELEPIVVMAKFYPWIIKYTIVKGLNPDNPRYLTKVTQTL